MPETNPKKEQAFEAVKKILKVTLWVSRDELTPDMTHEQIGIDSLDVIQLCMEIEKELNCIIPDDECEAWKTLGDVVDSYEKKMA